MLAGEDLSFLKNAPLPSPAEGLHRRAEVLPGKQAVKREEARFFFGKMAPNDSAAAWIEIRSVWMLPPQRMRDAEEFSRNRSRI